MKPEIQRMMGQIYRDRVFRMTAAYRSAKAPFDLELEQTYRDIAAYDEDTKANPPGPQDFDEETGFQYDYGEALGERLDDANDALNDLRKAFAIVAYHAWERGALRWFAAGNQKLNHAGLIQAFEASPYVINKDGLRDLKDLVNCLKHNSTTSGPALWGNRPDLFKPGFNPNTINPITNNPPSSVDWEGEIVLVDAHMDGFFELVRVSSPK